MCFRGGVHPATQGVFSSYFLQCQEIPTEYIMLSLKQGFPFSIIYIWFFPQKLEKLVELTLFKKTWKFPKKIVTKNTELGVDFVSGK